ncbi:hypothetical protein [Novispirillum itersonii]|nr:hypothetical protein [Novispirillum itersonii]
MSEDLTHADPFLSAAGSAAAAAVSGPEVPPASAGGASSGPAPGASAVGGAAAPSGPAAGAAVAGSDAAGSAAGAATPAQGLTPEAYQPFTLPQDMAVDDGLLGRFRSVAAGLGLTQQQAQQLVDLRVEQARQEAEAHTACSRQWVEQARRDPEFGGAGFQTALAVADRGLAAFATPDLRTLLDHTGLGNHPEVIRLAYRIGRTLAEPGPVQPGAVPAEAMSTADFYAREVFGS